MTNILFSILTVLVTNVSEIQAPVSPYITTFPTWPPYTAPPPPKTMSRYTTCHRITNAVARFGDVTLDKELGRELLWSTTEDFVEVTTWKSSGVRTNDYSNVTNVSNWWGNTVTNLTIPKPHWNIENNPYTLEGPR